MDEQRKYGVLLNGGIKLHRKYFEEMCKLLGVMCLYYAPRPNKHWTTYAEIKSNYFDPILVGTIFDEHPTQQTLKKMGWVSELQENSSIIHVPYDLPNIQQGALFAVPSGLDDGKARLFRVIKMTTSIVYPASISCEIIPEYENLFDESLYDHSNSSFNLLNRED